MAVGVAAQSRCKPVEFRIPSTDGTFSMTGNTAKCSVYLITLAKDDRLRLKSVTPEIYFHMIEASASKEEREGDFYCEDCTEMTHLANGPEKWEIHVFGADGNFNARRKAFVISGEIIKTPIVTAGVLNGRAISFPKPPYPAEARAKRIAGSVRVNVVVDESGKVYSADAPDAPVELRDVCEEAARNVVIGSNANGKRSWQRGVIVYNFAP